MAKKLSRAKWVGSWYRRIGKTRNPRWRGVISWRNKATGEEALGSMSRPGKKIEGFEKQTFHKYGRDPVGKKIAARQKIPKSWLKPSKKKRR